MSDEWESAPTPAEISELLLELPATMLLLEVWSVSSRRSHILTPLASSFGTFGLACNKKGVFNYGVGVPIYSHPKTVRIVIGAKDCALSDLSVGFRPKPYRRLLIPVINSRGISHPSGVF